jgi:hypothetical protein
VEIEVPTCPRSHEAVGVVQPIQLSQAEIGIALEVGILEVAIAREVLQTILHRWQQ